MHRESFTAAAAVLGLVLIGAVATAPAQASGQKSDRRAPMRLARMEGWVVTSELGAKYANAESAAEIFASYERGYPLVFVAEGREEEIPLADQESAADQVGRRVAAIGQRDAEGVLHVGTWRDAPARPTPSASTPPADGGS